MYFNKVLSIVILDRLDILSTVIYYIIFNSCRIKLKKNKCRKYDVHSVMICANLFFGARSFLFVSFHAVQTRSSWIVPVKPRDNYCRSVI